MSNETRNLKQILKHSESQHNIKLLRSVRSSNRLKLVREEKSSGWAGKLFQQRTRWQKNIYPVEGYFGSEFPAVCNHCGLMAAWSCKTLKSFENFLRFLKKTTPLL